MLLKMVDQKLQSKEVVECEWFSFWKIYIFWINYIKKDVKFLIVIVVKNRRSSKLATKLEIIIEFIFEFEPNI